MIALRGRAALSVAGVCRFFETCAEFKHLRISDFTVLSRGECIENNGCVTVVMWGCFTGAYLDATPAVLCVYRMLQALLIAEVCSAAWPKLSTLTGSEFVWLLSLSSGSTLTGSEFVAPGDAAWRLQR